MKGVLFLGGELKNTFHLRRLAKSADFIVAADSGALNAIKLGVRPHYVVGDLDSISSATIQRLKSTKIIRYPQKKDRCDGELALKLLLSKKPDEIIIFGTIGGRPDHSLASLSLLAKISKKIPAKMVSHDFEIFFTKESLTLKGKKGDLVSILPLSLQGAKLKTQGLLYTLNNEHLRFGGHGVSNQLVGSKAHVQVKRGAVFVFHRY